MKNLITAYCRLEIFCSLNLELFLKYDKEQALLIQILNKSKNIISYYRDYDVFAENHHNFNSVISCLSQIEQEWRKLNPTLIKNDGNQIMCPSVLLYNKWGNHLTVGMYLDRIFIFEYSKYTTEWQECLANLDKNEEREILLYIPEPIEFGECEFIPNKKAHLLLKEWLDNNNYIKDFNDEVYYSYLLDIERRNNQENIIDIDDIIF
jgi:hypothetical protein